MSSNFVRYSIVLVMLMCLPCWTQTTATGHASATQPCSVANTGNGNKIQINCGIGKEQGEKVLAILNKIVANHLDPNAVMEKLDEILRAVNPNIPTKVYSCAGGWRTVGPGASSGLEISLGAGDDPSFKQMIDLVNARPRKNEELLRVCTSQIESKPEWLTPRLFCAIAYHRMGDSAKAKEMVNVYDEKKGPSYDGNQYCQQLSSMAHSQVP